MPVDAQRKSPHEKAKIDFARPGLTPCGALFAFWRAAHHQAPKIAAGPCRIVARQNPISASKTRVRVLGRVASRPEPLTLTVQPKEQAHGEESKEGRESEGRHQGCSEEGQGARTVTLTRFQIHERLGGLAGEMKAARELDRINADTLAAKEHELTLAAQAKEKSEANITRLEEEARSLATQYASSVEELINGPTAGDDGISVTNIFENPVYTNGISRALDAAQNP